MLINLSLVSFDNLSGKIILNTIIKFPFDGPLDNPSPGIIL